jgi:hypothetical protein
LHLNLNDAQIGTFIMAANFMQAPHFDPTDILNMAAKRFDDYADEANAGFGRGVAHQAKAPTRPIRTPPLLLPAGDQWIDRAYPSWHPGPCASGGDLPCTAGRVQETSLDESSLDALHERSSTLRREVAPLLDKMHRKMELKSTSINRIFRVPSSTPFPTACPLPLQLAASTASTASAASAAR